jgi:hypothetical protein
LIRDTLRFGAKPAGVADATLTRTGAGALRVDTHLGVGVNPAAWGSAHRAFQVGAGGSLLSDATAPAATFLANNSYFDGTNFRALFADFGAQLKMGATGFGFATAPSVAAGAAQTFTTRMTISPGGTTSLTTDAGGGEVGLVINRPDGLTYLPNYMAFKRGGANKWWFGLWNDDSYAIYRADQGTAPLKIAPTGTLTLTPDAGQAALSSAPGQRLTLTSPGGTVVGPLTDNSMNLGFSDQRWATVWANTGTIQTSSAAVKEGITPLDPAACYQAAKDVRWYEYAYLPPTYTAPEPPPDIAYDAADDNETKAEKKAARDEAEAQAREAHLKMVAETAPARHQRGFVFPAGAESKDEAGGTLPPVPDLFGLSDRESTTPQADLATLGAAMQELIRRFEVVEAKVS